PDAVVRESVLGKVVGADLLGAVAALHHSAPLVPLLLGLLLALDLEQTTAQDLHRFRAVLDLAALVLALDRDAARDVRDLHRAVGRVHALTARAAGRGDIDFQIALV